MLTSLTNRKNKIFSIADAMLLIKDGDTIVTSGFTGTGSPETLFRGLARRLKRQVLLVI
jgi:acyl CoA:acetate/3-ketoacid CoA transferase alpha subunit